ncbi:transmembrane protein 144 [Thecamonas trahens ATCC 50062]|uniref:Transmembrane protein 144 n=1 Tax=Thecamonas trahens ATCC 50062 TaxID=461836 RepID=A0A0L0DMB0_THETB|nr:transmembrane protein 144 [Thecamonas trahens ATCC 50062]KNC53151.1 transmembrane protein 144 [Thecamonas trahens ATCC 50062]|eukprot:XP_013754624.1 transmembrane protein 144 [Thecamonas trahens ATCC 50062]
MGGDAGLGFGAAAIAVVCFGSNFVPVKKFQTGDGMFFQWVMCAAIFCAGVCVNAVRESPEFHYLAMLGGFLWCTGNLFSVFVIRAVGLGLGLCLWGSTNLIMGWASGKFGLFGLDKEPIANPGLNLVGVLVAVCATLAFAAVKPDLSSDDESRSRESRGSGNVLATVAGRGSGVAPAVGGQKRINAASPETALLAGVADPSASPSAAYYNVDEEALFGSPRPGMAAGDGDERDVIDAMDPFLRRALGIAAALLAGTMFGVNFDPPIWLIDHNKGSSNAVDYVFAHFTGIFVTSTVYFLAYCAYMSNAPVINPKLVLPAFASGLIWAMADISWFVANTQLSLVVAFPIVTTGPGIVASLWGVCVFKEIRGTRNFAILGAAFLLTIISVTLITLSRN